MSTITSSSAIEGIMSRYLLVYSFIFLIYCLHPSMSVDQSNFKTCDQSSFCKRHRDLKEGSITYSIVAGSISSEKVDNVDRIVALLQDNANPEKQLKLTVSLTGESRDILRVHLNEVNPLRARYEGTLSLADGVKFTDVTTDASDANGFTVKFGQDNKHKAIFYSNPFNVAVYNEDKLILTLNQRQLLKFEYSRQKTDQDNNDLGEWEESFKGHSDSKPHGPMSVGMDINFVNIDHVYGLPEHADSFSLRNTKGSFDPYRLYNLDVFEYATESTAALYGGVPLLVGHTAEETIGVYWLNPSETWIDIEAVSPSAPSTSAIGGFFGGGDSSTVRARSSHWISETGVIDVWILSGPKPSDISKQNAYLFGTHPLPPYYSIGYHQSRWNYFTQEEVAEIDDKFDQHDVPLDAIWLDVEYTEGRSKKYFTWDPHGFSDVRGLISNLTSKGRRLITIIDPHLKRDSNYPVYNEAVERKFLIKTKDGSDYDGWCWPGSSSWPDYFNPEVFEWWANKFDPEFFPGFPGGIVDIWNDMNEPSVFNGPEITAPKDLIHHNGLEHRDVHNMYGLMMTKATFTGLQRHRPNLRSFILTRSFFAGSQRYCAAWTGDNMAKYEHLKATIPMMLSLNLAGIAFSGADVPGFFYNPEPELVVRWYQAGALQPFFRGHGHIDTKKREPWNFDEETLKLIRAAIRTRYLYLPYMYGLFRENSVHGTPIMRPLWYHFASDVTTFSADESYLLGPSLLVHPVTDKGLSTLDVYFPGTNEDTWLDIESNHVYAGGNSYNIPVTLAKIPYFHRAGSIIPKRERIRRSAAITLNDPLTIDVVLDSNGNANGTLYLDDGNSLDYTKGQYILASLTYSHGHLAYKLKDGKYDTDVWIERVYIRQIKWKPSKAKVTQGDSTDELQFKQTESDVIVIRKPGVKLTHDWIITIG